MFKYIDSYTPFIVVSDHSETAVYVPLTAVTRLGVYIRLFLQCIGVLVKRKQRQHLLLFLLTTLFGLATTSLIASIVVADKAFLSDNVYRWWTLLQVILLFLANLIADLIMLWRCYAVWGKRRNIVILPAVLCMINYVIALVVICRFRGGWQFFYSGVNYDSTLNGQLGRTKQSLVLWVKDLMSVNYINCSLYFTTAFSNMFLTMMIAGRVLYISRKVKGILGVRTQKMYNLIIAVTVESGMMYPVVLIIYAALMLALILKYDGSRDGSITGVVIAGSIIQNTIMPILGISQTLLIVRIARGLSFSTVDEAISISTMQIASAPACPGTMRSDTVLDISPKNLSRLRRHSFDTVASTRSRLLYRSGEESVGQEV
ncbi:hypothetical protein Moror_8616 [Moniliophthora roreri MCA 2997]|uniref:Uncharacterized protein n=1 Tax=Moniliophthora roreri (strain MCA 2997) TaxID=1381753 RepID=V2XB11_MONRO|nr:hypothetical protein Moror_8616 [Moniliophthora roreri MCA 2997]